MRLYVRAWLIARRPLERAEILGCEVRRDDIIAISPYVQHRLPQYWDHPEDFDSSAGRPKHAYLPFSARPRQCIGNSFAMMEAQLVLTTILGRYRLDLVPDHPVVKDPRVTLRPRLDVRARRVRLGSRGFLLPGPGWSARVLLKGPARRM